jgi:hypothetical protein
MSWRAGVVTVTMIAIIGIAGLLIAAGGDQRLTAFSLGVPPAVPVETLRSGQVVCQGPFTTPAPFAYVRPWITPTTGPGPTLALSVRDAAPGPRLATGTVPHGYSMPIAPSVALSTTVRAGSRVRVCLRSLGRRDVQLLGNNGLDRIAAARAGTLNGSSRSAIALLLLRRHPKSLLSLVPTVFSRASLFRPGWVGPWTYWLLSVALLGAFVLGAVALIWAVRSDAMSADP